MIMAEEKQPSLAARQAVMSIMNDIPTEVIIPGTRHKVKLRFRRDCTVDKVTNLLLQREEQEETAEGAEALMRSAAKHPYLNLKIAVCYVLNDYWKLKLWYPLVWRWWAYVWRLNEAQVAAVLDCVKKKTSDFLLWYSMNTQSAKAIRADLKTMATQSRSPLTQKSGEEQRS